MSKEHYTLMIEEGDGYMPLFGDDDRPYQFKSFNEASAKKDKLQENEPEFIYIAKVSIYQ